jgi:hypothetical protein
VSLLLQQSLVGLVVLGCALFSAWRLCSVAVRLRLLGLLGRVPWLADLSVVRGLRERTSARQLDACGGCAGAPKPGAASPRRTTGALRR